MQSARGKYLLFADADGATHFPDLDKLTKAMHELAPEWQTEAIVIGSRAHLEDEAIATRSFFRYRNLFYHIIFSINVIIANPTERS